MPRQRLITWCGALVLLVGAALPASAANVVIVRMDEARIAKVPEKVATIVVGNPLIADVTLQSGGIMVITGKGYGDTNLIALDRGGNVLAEQTIQVQGPSGAVVVVYRGVERESYNCTPICERRVTLGDTPAFFTGNLGQAGARAQAAQSVAASR
jgi:hypothetical protein